MLDIAIVCSHPPARGCRCYSCRCARMSRTLAAIREVVERYRDAVDDLDAIREILVELDELLSEVEDQTP